MKVIIYYLILINALGLVLMLMDKIKAKKKKLRIPEVTLLGIGLIGGSLGACLGMYLFRHKTKQPKFYITLPLFLLINIVALYFLAK